MNSYSLNIKSIIRVISLSLVFFLFFQPSPVHAANIGLSIYPPLVKVVIRPGKTISQVFKVQNLSDTDQTLVARLIPFTDSDELGNPVIDPRATAPWLGYFSLANSYIKLDQPFTLKAGKSDQLILTLQVPDTAPLKDLYATLLITSYTNKVNTLLQGTALSASIGSNILISVSSQAFPPTVLKVTDLLPEPGKYFQIGDWYFLDNITPVYFTAMADNEGNFTAQTQGVFKIEKSNGTPINLQSILPQYVLAHSQRRLSTLSDTKFYYTPGFAQIGHYDVRIDIRSESANASTKIEVIFFPGKIFLGIIAAIIFLNVIIKISYSQDRSPDRH